MKKILIVAFLVGTISSCTEPTVKSKQTNYTIQMFRGRVSDPLNIVVIEGCEYFICMNHNENILCHKGNCKNVIHPEHKRR